MPVGNSISGMGGMLGSMMGGGQFHFRHAGHAAGGDIQPELGLGWLGLCVGAAGRKGRAQREQGEEAGTMACFHDGSRRNFRRSG
jgi:hypothetical protein